MVRGDRVGTGALGRRIILALVLLSAAATFIAYAHGKDMILELKDIQFFKAQLTNSSPVTIKLSGLAFHSSLAIQDVTTSQNDESLQILVHLTPATEKLSGNLDYTFSVPASVNTVTFGEKKAPIWSRNTGIVQPK